MDTTEQSVLKTVTGKVASVSISSVMKSTTYARLVQRLEKGDTNLSRFVEDAVKAALASEAMEEAAKKGKA